MREHFILPHGNIQIAFSGGRTSAYMLHHILEANGDLPDRVKVTFQNTGREMPETLDFVQECGGRWGVNIVWLEYRAMAPFFGRVSHNSAARNGEPFEALIRKRKFLPNQNARFCTTELKVRTAKRYLRSLGWDYWTNCVGLRADEQRRIKPEGVNLGDRWTVWQPLNNAGVSKMDVSAFWTRQPFDLRLPNVRGNCWLGNCDGCFLKSEANIAALAREYPDRAVWWEDMEAIASELTSGTGGKWSKRYSRREMREYMERQGDWALSTDGALCQADGGECM
ncbi:phosphoadenosine phosphosulfate reductase family protein [Paenirhodobacter sp. CAU 1674]|uniref:phosphoadenosine phosphosulfate reductase family protein n=1 Tax=Paenirhodobacter sp. CAU 1674 TaxID=3032596 RepID=UPI0023DA4271|nr:phosphoadenosine phosphosulfate reductase family protein [Paenirhodobacter sp. CAU 1674]MDF2140825.1 phosphoadenosine phosphosulfate reductase family protein [Paenirhodobacter sp. CAU 1674]